MTTQQMQVESVMKKLRIVGSILTQTQRQCMINELPRDITLAVHKMAVALNDLETLCETSLQSRDESQYATSGVEQET